MTKVWNGSPISKYLGSIPKCKYCRRLSLFLFGVFLFGERTWKCDCPESTDPREYAYPCSELDWNSCPLNKSEGSEMKTIEKDMGSIKKLMDDLAYCKDCISDIQTRIQMESFQSNEEILGEIGRASDFLADARNGWKRRGVVKKYEEEDGYKKD